MATQKQRLDKRLVQRAALDKVRALFANAEAVFKSNPAMADRYVRKARNTAQKARLPIPKELKKRFCRHCNSFWLPGKTVRVRLQQQKVVYYCLVCKRFKRHPYVREKKARRKAKPKAL